MSVVMHHSSNSVPVVHVTEAAKQHILVYLHKNKHLGLRLSVKKTGCSGLSYVLDDIDHPMPDDMHIALADNYFISIDKKSYPYVKGVEIDYVKQGLQSKFVFHNPNQTGQCGCGESFTVE